MKSKHRRQTIFIRTDDGDLDSRINKAIKYIDSDDIIEIKEIHSDYYKYNILIIYRQEMKND